MKELEPWIVPLVAAYVVAMLYSKNKLPGIDSAKTPPPKKA